MSGQRWNKPWRWAAPTWRDPLPAQRGLRQNNTPTQEVEADALRRYDRPLPSMEAYEQCGPTGRWRRRWSSEHISTDPTATIQQYDLAPQNVSLSELL